MHTTNLKDLIQSAAPVSPDRKYSLAWSWGGTIGILNLADGEQLLCFREERGAILRAGFSPDMRELLAENEDGSFSIWYTAAALRGRPCRGAGNIVDFMLANELVPCLNVTPGLKACRFEQTLRDFRWARWDYFDWGNRYVRSERRR